MMHNIPSKLFVLSFSVGSIPCCILSFLEVITCDNTTPRSQTYSKADLFYVEFEFCRKYSERKKNHIIIHNNLLKHYSSFAFDNTFGNHSSNSLALFPFLYCGIIHCLSQIGMIAFSRKH